MTVETDAGRADRSVVWARNAALSADPAADRERAVQVRRLVGTVVSPTAAVGPPIEVVDVGANPLDDVAPYQLLLDSGAARVTGFEPQPEALQELHRRAGPHERYLPLAVGDGQPHTLHLCAAEGFASLLEPDPSQLALLVDFPELAAVTHTDVLPTHRLDDIREIERIDLLKMDIQGGELAVLRAGRRALAQAVAIQVEVGFHRLYRDQPTFADVDLELRDQGLVPLGLVSSRTWPLAPVQWADPLERASRQLVEADVLYVRDLARPDELTDVQLARLAVIADTGYGNFGVALRCLLTLIARGLLDEEVERSYRDLVGPRLAAG